MQSVFNFIMKQEYLFFYLHKYLLIYNNHIIFMSLFLITAKSRLAANLTVIEKGMTVEVSCRDSELYANGCPHIKGAFMRKYGIDLMKLCGLNVIWNYFDIKKISWFTWIEIFMIEWSIR